MHKINNLIIPNRGSSLIISLLLACSLLSGCASWLPRAHRADITQGVAIKPEQLAKLKTGMDQSDILQLLGNPSLIDPFHPDRWDYIYRFIPGYGTPEESRVTLFFDGDVLKSIDSSGYTVPREHKSDELINQEDDSPGMMGDGDGS